MITIDDIITNLTIEDAAEWEANGEKYMHVTDVYLDRNDLPRRSSYVDLIEDRLMAILADNK